MAAGATGTPTSNFSIPKYATSADAPNGTGFNSAMDAIDSLLAQAPLSGHITGIATGTVPVWSGAAWVKPTGTPDGSKFLRDDGAWASAGGGGAGGFIDLRNPRVTSLAGNSFFTVLGLTDWDFGHWEFVKDVDGKVYGVARLGATVTTINLLIAANATSGVTRLSVRHKTVTDADSLNPGSLTAITSQDITVPGTAYLAKKVTFTITETVAGKDAMIIEVFHEGAHANDTLAVNTLLLGGWLA